ncbi:MAG: hypothetical protein U0165_18475 [Polyangiaceae bacterium]
MRLRPTPNTSASVADDDADALNDKILVGLVGLFRIMLLLQLCLFQYGRDQGIYAVVADAMRQGLAPYRDAWDFKPPGIFLIYASRDPSARACTPYVCSGTGVSGRWWERFAFSPNDSWATRDPV